MSRQLVDKLQFEHWFDQMWNDVQSAKRSYYTDWRALSPEELEDMYDEVLNYLGSIESLSKAMVKLLTTEENIS